MTDKTLSCIGLCKKAGRLISGTELTAEAIRGGKIKAAFTSLDASKNTVKRISDCCSYRGVRYIQLPHTSDQIGRALGRESGIASFGVTDEGFADMIIRSL